MPERHQRESAGWTDYWSKAGALGAACLPGAPASTNRALQSAWDGFFAGLDPKSSVLDLGCGSGAVLKAAVANRSDLVLTGVDYAQELPPAPAGVSLMAGVSCESLPFDDQSIDAVTSQFAIEYTDVSQTLAEVKRVLTAKGRVMFILHHADGLVVRHNQARLDGLNDMLAEGSLVPAALELKRHGDTSDPSCFRGIDALLKPLQAKHGKGGVIHDVLSILAPALVAPQGLEALEILKKDLDMEAERLQALSNAALSASEAEGIVDQISAFTAVSLSPVHVDGEDLPLAWCIR